MTVNEDYFPNLAKNGGYKVTSEPTEEYNCIAWADGVSDEWWDPAQDYAWPGDSPRNYSVDSLMAVYQSRGFVPCDSGAIEPGYEKIAIYAEDGEYDHAARQLPDGTWTSKLGADEDISHQVPESLTGKKYGPIVGYMKRPSGSAPKNSP